MKYFQCPRFCTYACSFKILYLVGERAGRLLPRDLKISPRSTRLDIPSACPHARLLWRVLPVAGAGSWGQLLVQYSSSRQGSCSGALALAHPSSAAHWGASGADGPTGVPPAAAVRTKFPGVELSLSDTWKGSRRGSLLGSLWRFS